MGYGGQEGRGSMDITCLVWSHGAIMGRQQGLVPGNAAKVGKVFWESI